MANSTPRRRSARISSKSAKSPHSAAHKTPHFNALGSLVERDETPDAESSIDNVVATPAAEISLREKILELTSLKTPSTEPIPSRAIMHPKTAHQTTAKAPDSGLKLGFADISGKKSLQDTPSKSESNNLPSSVFEFKFASESHLSNEAQTLMENVREEAARIKAQMQAEKEAQEQKDGEAEDMFAGVRAVGRKIAQPKGKAGRFSDVHMAQFKKMDSIANHASAFRTKSGFAQPTQQSLKRSGSRAGLDIAERPRTAGKGTPGRAPPPFGAPNSAVSQFKSIPQTSSNHIDNPSPAKRARLSGFEGSSFTRPNQLTTYGSSKTSNLPRPTSGSLLSPTKASVARAAPPNTSVSSLKKSSTIRKSSSVMSLKAAFEAARSKPGIPTSTTFEAVSKIPRSDSITSFRPLPAVPKLSGNSEPGTNPFSIQQSQSTKTFMDTPKPSGFASKLPTFAGLKSILRPSRAASSRKPAVVEMVDWPKRPHTANAAIESPKKVDFTPSVKSRYAVKLAAQSPSPAKHAQSSPSLSAAPRAPTGDSTEDEEQEDDEEVWEDAEDDVEYPTLPPPSPEVGPVVHTFSAKAKEHNRRESKEFKSIFTTLHHPSRASQPSTLTSVNTTVNKTNPSIHAGKIMQSPSNHSLSKQSPSTIRRVRSSDASKFIQPFEDTIQTVSHGLSAKKRRHESAIQDDKRGLDEDSKENRRISTKGQLEGRWDNNVVDEDEGDKRGGKRMRMGRSEEPAGKKADVKKPSAAREAAAKSAKDRKGKGVLSLSRLNMLSRPKQRN